MEGVWYRMGVVVMSRKARIGVWEPLRSYFLGAEGMEMERLRKEKGDLLGIGSQNPFLPLKTIEACQTWWNNMDSSLLTIHVWLPAASVSCQIPGKKRNAIITFLLGRVTLIIYLVYSCFEMSVWRIIVGIRRVGQISTVRLAMGKPRFLVLTKSMAHLDHIDEVPKA